MNAPLPNFGLREEIITYWSERAETFDQSFAHGISTEIEERAWANIIGSTIGEAPKSVLELACGTGEISRVLLRLGYNVTALDFAEPMLERAKAKLGASASISFRLGDAENTMEPSETYDAVISRHLVWTLLQPQETFNDWFRVLKPGGVLVILDGNWSEPSRLGRFAIRLARLVDRLAGKSDALPPALRARHQEIMRRLPFSDGLTEARIKPLLEAAGFRDFRRISPRPVLAAQRRAGSLGDALRLGSHEQVYLCARRT